MIVKVFESLVSVEKIEIKGKLTSNLTDNNSHMIKNISHTIEYVNKNSQLQRVAEMN